MTVIAWDGKILAADKQCGYGGMRCTVTKIFRVGKLLVGGAGDFTLVLEMVDWVRRGRPVDSFPANQRSKDDWQALMVIEPDGSIVTYERTPHPIRYEQKQFAIGSGREFAMGAMYMGANAVRAVEAAIALEVNCGIGIDTLTLD